MDAITVTGRRIRVKSMQTKHQKLILSGTKDMEKSFSISKDLIEACVEAVNPDALINKDCHIVQEPGLPPSCKLNYSKLSISEESDIMYLLRLQTLRNIVSFSFRCPNRRCKGNSHKPVDYTADIRKFKRKLLKCGDMNCPCQTFDYDPDDLVKSNDPKEIVDFSSIPEDHMLTTPPIMTFTLEECGWTVKCKLMDAVDKPFIGKWLQADDDEVIVKSLVKAIVDINDVVANYKSPSKTLDKVLSEKLIYEALQEITQFDLMTIRDFIDSKTGGVDSDVDFKCIYCNESYEHSIPMASSFFLPKSMTSKNT
jgi:aspartate carbamoyltransferase regulatory subunit